MTTQLETGLPSVRQIQHLIKERQQVEIKLLTTDTLVGRISWLDQYCICLADENDQSTIVWQHAIAYIKPKS